MDKQIDYKPDDTLILQLERGLSKGQADELLVSLEELLGCKVILTAVEIESIQVLHMTPRISPIRSANERVATGLLALILGVIGGAVAGLDTVQTVLACLVLLLIVTIGGEYVRRRRRTRN